jgi:ABC-type nitrate/sulfonate/bicarbonate transport system substrate-binding protein
LQRGQIDGAPLTPPYPALAERQGMHVLGTPDDLRIEYLFSGIGTSVAKIAQQREAVRQVLKARLATLDALRSEREMVIPIMIERLAMEPEIAAATYDHVHGLWSRDDSISGQSVDLLQRLDVESGALDAPVAYEQLVDTGVLAEAQRAMAQ